MLVGPSAVPSSANVRVLVDHVQGNELKAVDVLLR
jgi:hypothetical protein